jgi:predicted PurR-regulated permease PerM
MTTNLTKQEITTLSLEIILKAVILGVIFYYALAVIKPFIIPVLWGIIIAVTLSPLIKKMDAKLNLKRSMIITILTTLMSLALLIPTYMLSDSVIDSSQKLATDLQTGSLVIPSPTPNVKKWPLIGEQTYSLWSDAAKDLKSTLHKLKPVISKYSPKVASAIGGALGAILQFVIALIISAIFLVNQEGSLRVYHAISRRLAGEKGIEWAYLSAATIRSVVQGVIGIAITQAVFAFIGLALIGMPLAWFWAFLVLFFAIIQLPPIIILGPIIAYVFSFADATPATIFAIYSIFVSMADGFLKPIFLGRGVDIPMLVILLGAIGGMIVSGILGLFVGSVGLALAYKLFMMWLEDDEAEAKEA